MEREVDFRLADKADFVLPVVKPIFEFSPLVGLQLRKKERMDGHSSSLKYDPRNLEFDGL
jgi:hypothetical protein